LRKNKVKELNGAAIAIAARIQPDGRLLPVAGEHEKLVVAARERSFPRIHSVVLAKDSTSTFGQSQHDFCVYQVDTMAAMLKMLY